MEQDHSDNLTLQGCANSPFVSLSVTQGFAESHSSQTLGVCQVETHTGECTRTNVKPSVESGF